MPDPLQRLPRRDFILLPLISLLTCVILFGAAEIFARVGWPEVASDSCTIADASLGFRFKPNCTSATKAMEGPWVTNQYNECGYRTDQPCAPRPAGVRRVVLMGSSIAEGYLIPFESTIGKSLETSLTSQCGQQVQVENMSMINYSGELIATQLDEALALKPDVVVYVVTPFDLDVKEKPADVKQGQPVVQKEWLRRIQELAVDSRAALLAKHFMFVNSERYASLYLSYGDRADFLRPPFTAAWHKRLAYLDNLLDRMQQKITAAGAKLVFAYVPSRAHAIYLSMADKFPKIDPLAFGNALGEMAQAHGIAFADLSGMFTPLPNAGALFYPNDGHLNEQGQPMVGRTIAQKILSSFPSFEGCVKPLSASVETDDPTAPKKPE